MKTRKVLIASVIAFILGACAFQTIEAGRAAGAAQKRLVGPATDEPAVSSPDYHPSPSAPPQAGSVTPILSQSPHQSTISDAVPPFPQAQTSPTVTLRAGSGAAILFMTQNGRTIKDVPPQAANLPHLVLYRDGALTESAERTLVLTVDSLPLSISGVTVTLEIRTQHGNPDLGPGYDKSISVWRESKLVQNPQGISQEPASAVFVREFTEWTVSGTETIATPTDYFQYDVTVTDAEHPVTDPLVVIHQNYAFLMENQLVLRLPEVKEMAEGAAPDELVMFFCDMIPFRKSLHDLSTWLPRNEVATYIQIELAPAMIEAFRIQTDEWGFPWYQAWTSPRLGGNPEQLSVALTDGQAWFHGPSPSLANSDISIRVNAAEYIDYDTLTDGIMSAFHHELFHNLQRNISQELGGEGNLMGANARWLLITEGTAMLATSVGQQAQQFAHSTSERAFISRANEFLGQGKGPGGLNTSYAELLPYRAGLYWRFLYEQCGGMSNGSENPTIGMRVIRQTLVTLLSGNVVDISASSDLVGNIPSIMNQVFAQAESWCPFNNYEDSLLHFAQAIYALRLDGGRCNQPGLPVGCGFYDPNNLYSEPLVNTVTFSGQAITLTGAEGTESAAIGSSFGIDFIDVHLDQAADGKPLRLEFNATPGTGAYFKVQLWKLTDLGDETPAALIREEVPEILASQDSDGRVTYLMPVIDTAAYTRVALIISRLDANEKQDSVGEYTVALGPETS